MFGTWSRDYNNEITAVVCFYFNFQIRGVHIVVVGVGPDAKKSKYRKVLEFIGGDNLFFVDDYENLDDATQDIRNLICRKLKLVVLISFFHFYHPVSNEV